MTELICLDFSSRFKDEGLSEDLLKEFRAFVFSFYEEHGRHDMEWRHTTDPYRIIVSEIMLQQTQVSRVAQIFPEFIRKFPDAAALADAEESDVLSAWQGMGYNRRALNLQKLCRIVCREKNGVFPRTPEELVQLPGIGPATSCSIAAFTYNIPVVFIETNIRRVVIHLFFRDLEEIDDSQIYPIVEAALPRDRSREWYWALMDLGAEMKKSIANPNRKSRQYVKQSKFEGSNRQVRGDVLKRLLLMKTATADELAKETGYPVEKVSAVLSEMHKEGFFKETDERFSV